MHRLHSNSYISLSSAKTNHSRNSLFGYLSNCNSTANCTITRTLTLTPILILIRPYHNVSQHAFTSPIWIYNYHFIKLTCTSVVVHCSFRVVVNQRMHKSINFSMKHSQFIPNKLIYCRTIASTLYSSDLQWMCKYLLSLSTDVCHIKDRPVDKTIHDMASNIC